LWLPRIHRLGELEQDQFALEDYLEIPLESIRSLSLKGCVAQEVKTRWAGCTAGDDFYRRYHLYKKFRPSIKPQGNFYGRQLAGRGQCHAATYEVNGRQFVVIAAGAGR